MMRFVFKVALPMAMTSAIAASCIIAMEKGDVTSPAGGIAIDTTATYTIVGVPSGKCVDVVGASTQSLADLEIAACNGATHQQFRAQSMGNGFFRLQNVNSGLCADVTGASRAAGAKLIQYACGAGASQQWSFTDITTGIERITSRNSSLVLDVTGQRTADGTPLEQWTSNGGANQEFRLEVVGKSRSSSSSSSLRSSTPRAAGLTPTPRPSARATP
jgi:polyhydroxybutyrate depolymerase